MSSGIAFPVPDWVPESAPALFWMLLGVIQGRQHLVRQTDAVNTGWHVPEGVRKPDVFMPPHYLLKESEQLRIGRLVVPWEVARFIGVHSPAEMLRRYDEELEELRRHRPITNMNGHKHYCQECVDSWGACQLVARLCRIYQVNSSLLEG